MGGLQNVLTLPRIGAAVAERLARSPPPPRRTGLDPRPGHRIFASGNRAGRCRWSAGLLGDLLLPPPLHSGAAPYPLQSSALKTSLLRAAQISSLTHFTPRVKTPFLNQGLVIYLPAGAARPIRKPFASRGSQSETRPHSQSPAQPTRERVRQCQRNRHAISYLWGRGGGVVRLLTSHLGEPGSIPGGDRSRILARGNRAVRCHCMFWFALLVFRRITKVQRRSYGILSGSVKCGHDTSNQWTYANSRVPVITLHHARLRSRVHTNVSRDHMFIHCCLRSSSTHSRCGVTINVATSVLAFYQGETVSIPGGITTTPTIAYARESQTYSIGVTYFLLARQVRKCLTTKTRRQCAKDNCWYAPGALKHSTCGNLFAKFGPITRVAQDGEHSDDWPHNEYLQNARTDGLIRAATLKWTEAQVIASGTAVFSQLLLCSAVTYPMDLVKTRLQLQGESLAKEGAARVSTALASLQLSDDSRCRRHLRGYRVSIPESSQCYSTPGSMALRYLFPCKFAIGSESSRAYLINCDPIANSTSVYTCLTSISEMSMKQYTNERAGKTGDSQEIPPTSCIVRHDSRLPKSGVNRPGVKPGSPWWEASSLTAQDHATFSQLQESRRGLVGTAVGVVRDEGLLKLWSGLSPAIYRNAVYCGARIVIYQQLRDNLLGPDPDTDVYPLWCVRSHGGWAVSLLASHQGEPGSIPGRVTGFSQVGIVPDDAVGRRIFSGISRSPRPFIPAPLHIHFNHPLKTSLLGATQISSLTPSLLKSAVNGLVAGVVAQFLANPADLVKIRMQAEGRRRLLGQPPSCLPDIGEKRESGCLSSAEREHERARSSALARLVKSPVSAFKQIYKKGGIRGLWKGCVPNVQRAAMVTLGDLTAYDYSKRFFLHDLALKDNYVTHILASVCAGFVAAVMGSPADVVKARIMNQPTDARGRQVDHLHSTHGHTHTHTVLIDMQDSCMKVDHSVIGCCRGLFYRNTTDCFLQTVGNEGVFALYKGFVPLWLRLAPWSLTFWLSYEEIKLQLGAHTF
ncbi:hypothetical protein PR048_024582 [Dryococelus australis]|uniref:Mitochondrial uncoupling protein 4 n=1 Tax=Dryococelus australis TaxID=614101 RepID=A0ABQ9GNZ9_9NEOP|nr:hypothetical protein PR048_024582 [Dryococelus australis]